MSRYVSLVCIFLVPAITYSYLEELNSNKATYLTAGVGQYVVFDCPIDFPHDTVIPYSLRWNKEGNSVFSWYEGVFTATDEVYSGRINLVPTEMMYGRGAVNLTAIRETDSGWYECTVFFPNRKPNTRPNGTWFHLNVDGGTLLAIPPINVTTLEGSPAHFPCVTRNPLATVTWYKDSVPLTELADLSSRSAVINDGSLTIANTDMADTGEYHCVVTNGQGDRQTAGAFLNVQFAAKVIFSPSEVYLPYGRPGSLDCHFRANPPLTNLRWEKDGFLFDPYNVPGVFYRRNGSLYFSKVDESHSGQYTCTPINDLGTVGPSPAVNVIVQRPPVFTVQPYNMYLRKIGDSLEMPCDAMDGDASHHPTIVWFRKDGLPLPLNRTKLANGNLTIESVKTTDAGVYQCVASNEAASISSDTEVMIETVAPAMAYNLTAVATTNSVKLHWIPGSSRATTEYSVWYRPVDTPEWRTTPPVVRGTTEVTLTQLSPGRLYEVMVLGQEMFSRALRIKTRDPTDSESDEPPASSGWFQGLGKSVSQPRDLAVNLTEDGYLLTWREPEFNLNLLKNYRVQWEENIVDTIDTFLLVTDLEEGSTVRFLVMAHQFDDMNNIATIVYHVPWSTADVQSYRALSVGVACGLAFLLVAAAAGIYLRKIYTINSQTPPK